LVGLTQEERDEVVSKLLKTMGLSKVAYVRVGDKKKPGLSGGERKRLSVAC